MVDLCSYKLYNSKHILVTLKYVFIHIELNRWKSHIRNKMAISSFIIGGDLILHLVYFCIPHPTMQMVIFNQKIIKLEYMIQKPELIIKSLLQWHVLNGVLFYLLYLPEE
jgi:hypothetical protein